MARSRPYYMLMASLPYLPPLFRNTRPPISRFRLDQRLSMLEPEDRSVIADIEAVFSREDVGDDDTDIVRNSERMTARLNVPTVRGVVERRLMLRSMVNAMRRRRRGEGPPPMTVKWAFGDLGIHIARHWNAPAFRLEGRLPQLLEIHRLLENDESYELEKLLLSVLWADIDRAAQSHHFDFEAVALYVIKWRLIGRWTGFDRDLGLAAFDALVDEALRPHQPLFDADGAPRPELVYEHEEP